MTLTRHTTSMDLMIQFSCDGMVPRKRFGPILQLLVGAATEQRTVTFVAHWQVVQDLQHVNQNSNRDREQNQRLERTHHLEQCD